MSDLSNKSKFPAALSKLTAALKSISFVNGQLYSGFYTLINGFHSIWHGKAVEAGITDKLYEPEDDTNWGHFKNFFRNHAKVLNDSRKYITDQFGEGKDLGEVLKDTKAQHSAVNIFSSFAASIPTVWGLAFCRGDYLGTIPNKIMKSLRSLGMFASSAYMIKQSKEQEKAESEDTAEKKDTSDNSKGKQVLSSSRFRMFLI